MTAAPVTPNWRSSQLPQLTGLPLLPVGAGADGKAPIDTNTGLSMAGWKTASWTPDAIARADSNVVTAVGMRCGPDAGGLLCIDADGATALEALLAAGCDPDAAGWRISRPTAPDRLKVVFRVPKAQWPAPGSRRAGKVVIKTGPREQLEFFWGKGQVVVAGLHRPSGALLEWIGGPASITELPPAWLTLWESAEPAAPAPAPPAAEINHRPDAIALEALLPRDLEQLARNGAGEGERNAALFKLAAAALAIQPAALSAGLLVDGTAESLVVAAAMRCSPPLAESEVLTILRSAESQPRTLDPGWPKRLRYHLNSRSPLKASKNTRKRPRPAAAAPEDAPPCSWADLLKRLPDGWVVTEAGTFPSKLSVGELAGVLQKHQQLLRYNDLTMFCEVHTRNGWCAVVDADMDSAYVLLSQMGWIIGLDPITKAVCHVARLRTFHPIRQYLLDLEQNTTIEALDLDDVAPRFFRATETLHVAMVRKWLVGAVARAMNPGCQMDYCLVLQSRQQGIGKSTSFSDLASPDWYTSTVPDADKDFLLNVHSCWIFELAELESHTGKRDAGRLKNLISTSIDMFRVPYGRTAERRKRGSVFCATVNEDTFLRDETGNRRYWVVPIEGSEPLDREGLKSARNGIWKAALAAWRADELPMLSRAQEALSEIQNGEFIQSDPWLAMLQASMELRTDRPECWSRPFSTAEALQAAALKNREQITRADENRIAPLLRQLGFEKGKNPITTQEGARVRLWIRAQPAQPCTTSTGGGCAPQDPLQQNGSRRPAQPAQPVFFKRSATAVDQQLAGAAAEPEPPYVAKKVVQVVHPPTDTTKPTAGTDSSPAQPLHNPHPERLCTSEEVVRPNASDPWCETAPPMARKVVHLPKWWQPWIVRLVRLREANPDHSPWQLANLLMGEQGIRTTPHDVARMLASWDKWTAETQECA